MKKALICGIGGQDGAYLAKLLIDKKYEVWGTSRDAQMASFRNLRSLDIYSRVKLLSMAPNDFRSVLTALRLSEPDEVYYLAGQSSVGLSFDQPAETLESFVIGMLNLLEAVRFQNRHIRIYHASSSECFGDLRKQAANEDSPFQPRSPYAVAKASAHWLASNYREAYGLFVCNGILFNHESPLRPQRFVTKKIISAAARIANGSREKLSLGRLDIVRDWGWAPEYVNAMWKMLQQETPEDFIIATGKSFSLEEFVATAFNAVSLDWHDHVVVNQSLYRPTDITWSLGNPSRANEVLDWQASFYMPDVVQMMVSEQLDSMKINSPSEDNDKHIGY
jgi:GDPmannose 4,6-dehydratase